MKQLLLVLFQLLILAGIPLAGQSQIVNDASELQNAINNASGDVTIKFAPSFTSGTINITQPAAGITVTVDGENFIWNNGVINLSGSGTGTLIIMNLKIDGTTASARLLTNTASNGELKLDKTEFYNARSGAIEISTTGSAYTTISNTKIYDNTAGRGPAVLTADNKSSNFLIKNSTIENNSGVDSGWEGGAIASKNYTGNIEINNTVFRNNVNKTAGTVAGGGGGAMTLNYFKGNCTINECLFQGNKTDGTLSSVKSTCDGGAIYVFDGQGGATININNTTFDSNLSYDDGGAMMIQAQGNPGLTTNITNCTFYNNIAYGLTGGNVSGGAIQFFRNRNGGLNFAEMKNTILNCTFVGNRSGNENSTVEQKGGAIGLSGNYTTASITYNCTLFAGNKVYNSSGQENTSSNYKDISNTTTSQGSLSGSSNIVNIDKGATPTYTAENILGKNYGICDNLSQIVAGVDNEIIQTIPIKPEGLADDTYNGSATLPTNDQRNYTTNKDQGSIEMYWVRFDANGGTWTGLNNNLVYDGTEYYEATNTKTDIYYKVTYKNGKVIAPTVVPTSLIPPAANLKFSKWVLDDGVENEWKPADPVDVNTKVKAIWDIVSTTYTVTYEPNGGIGITYPHPTTYNLGDSHTVMAYDHTDINFQANTGYSFVSWNTSNDGGGTSYSAGGTLSIDGDKVLYAIWKKDTDPVDPPKPPVPPVTPEEPEEPTPNPDAAIILRDIAPFCFLDEEFRIPFVLNYTKGTIEYIVRFSDKAKEAGFTDITEFQVLSGSYITVPGSHAIAAGS